MWKWLQFLFGSSGQEDALREDVADELQRNRRDGRDGASMLMVPPVVGPETGNEGSGGTDSAGGDGNVCGASCGVA